METEIFVRNFDRFFDMLNTRCLEEEIYTLKPDLKAYKEPNDERFKVYIICAIKCSNQKLVII